MPRVKPASTAPFRGSIGPALPGAPRRSTAVTGLAILETLAVSPAGLGVSDIARRIGFDIGQTHRILSALAEEGWVGQAAPSGIYVLTGKLLSLAGRLLEASDLRSSAMPILAELKSQTAETIHLAELRDDRLVCVARELSSEGVVVTSQIGDSWPIEGTALGAAVKMAWQESPALAAAATSPAAPIRPHGLALDLRADLRRGYSIDVGGYRRDICAVAAPILNLERIAVGALAISGPSGRLSGDRLTRSGALVRSAAAKISQALGYRKAKEVPSGRPGVLDAAPLPKTGNSRRSAPGSGPVRPPGNRGGIE